MAFTKYNHGKNIDKNLLLELAVICLLLLAQIVFTFSIIWIYQAYHKNFVFLEVKQFSYSEIEIRAGIASPTLNV